MFKVLLEKFSAIPWIYFALANPIFYSVTNFLEKFLVEKRIKNPILITIFIGLASLILGVIILAFKGFRIIETKPLILILISGMILDFYLIPYFKALTLDDASRVVPLFQFSPIFVLALSYAFLGEVLTLKQLVGFALIIVGGFALGAERIERAIFTPRKSFWLMVLTSFLYASTGVLFKFVVVAQDFWLILAYQSIGIGIGAIILLLLPSNRSDFLKETRSLKFDSYGILSTNICFNTLAQWAIFYAFSLAPVALVSIVAGIQPFFVLLFGVILSLWFPHFIKEDLAKSTVLVKVFSILPIFIGIFLVYQ